MQTEPFVDPGRLTNGEAAEHQPKAASSKRKQYLARGRP